MDSLIGDVLHAIEDAGMGGKTLCVGDRRPRRRRDKHGAKSRRVGDSPDRPAVGRGSRHRDLEKPVNTYDTAATIAWAFGLKPPATWIGRPVTEARSSLERYGRSPRSSTRCRGAGVPPGFGVRAAELPLWNNASFSGICGIPQHASRRAPKAVEDYRSPRRFNKYAESSVETTSSPLPRLVSQER